VIFVAEEKKEYTRFERARIIGARALQISRGAPPLVKTENKDPIRIAEAEFEAGAIPLDVKRKMPPRASS
jgi:DNA-directed RNA polymerase subunit K